MRQYETRVPKAQPQTLEALLSRWADLEPDRCIIYPNDRAINVRRLGKWPHVGFMGGDIDEDLIQAAAQEAIEAWGWGWAISKVGDPMYNGEVWAREYHELRRDTPAAAILSAHLQALEAHNQ